MLARVLEDVGCIFASLLSRRRRRLQPELITLGFVNEPSERVAHDEREGGFVRLGDAFESLSLTRPERDSDTIRFGFSSVAWHPRLPHDAFCIILMQDAAAVKCL
jgi:hypothetical protein